MSNTFTAELIGSDCDITDSRATLELIEETKPDIIFHRAAESFVSPSWRHPRRYMDVNYLGTVNLLDALQKLNKKDTIFHIPGSGEEYGLAYEEELPINEKSVLRPVNPYAVTKVAQDLIGYVYHKSYGLNVIRTRAFNHEGPRREKYLEYLGMLIKLQKSKKITRTNNKNRSY